MVTVRLPSILREPGAPEEVHIDADVATIGDLINALDYQYPGLASAIDDALYNFAVNDVLVLHRARRQALMDGDVVEIVPTIAGGQGI
jgi:molybdopterin converting factor small subunit